MFLEELRCDTLRQRPTAKLSKDVDVGNPACPVKEKKYVPLAGAVNFPVDKFMAFPMFSQRNLERNRDIDRAEISIPLDVEVGKC